MFSESIERRIRLVSIVIAVTCGAVLSADAGTLAIENRYSPWNRIRSQRPHTDYIVLHTTESSGKSALQKLRRYGEAHYLVDSDGRVYRIIAKEKIAKHAGLSLWEGHASLDNFSIGVEVVGYHDGKFSGAQIAALRELIRQLRSRYRIAPQNVLTHSMVAYGRPNRFQVNPHRGRKRCGMVFARSDVRELIGLNARPMRDSDVDKGNLRVGDAELFDFLFPGRAHSR